MPNIKFLTKEYNIAIAAREGTSDIGVVQDCLLQNNYGLKPEYAPEGGVIIDIGANIGCFTILAAKMCPRARVISYEPEPDNLHYLRGNIDLNGVSDRIKIHAKAVSNVNGRASISERQGSSKLDTVEKTTGFKLTECETVDLATVFAENQIERCDFLKVDAEWSEYLIFSAGPEVVERAKRIAMEFHPASKETYGELMAKLSLTHRYEALGSHAQGGYCWAWR